jgi:DNA polymerase III sliding clamp (beta) subunit (PCNA family)
VADQLVADLDLALDLDPERSTPSPMPTMTVTAADLAHAIDQVTPASSVDPELPLLQTVLIEAREGTLRLVATDRYRLAVRDLVSQGGDGEPFTAVVAAAALNRIRRGLDAGTVDVTRLEHGLIVGSGADAPSVVAMAAEFPPYEILMVFGEQATSAVVDRTALVDLFETAGDADLVRVTIGNGKLVLDDEPGRSIGAACDGPGLTVGLRPEFARYAAEAAMGPEVMIEVTEAVKPVVFRSATDSSFICMVMPIRLAA